jgi:hypothetical protein
MITRASTRFGVVISGKIALPYLIAAAPPKEPTTSFATYTKSSFCLAKTSLKKGIHEFMIDSSR